MLIYYNPHVDDFIAEPLQFKLLRRRALKKYGFLINRPIELNQEFHVLVDGTISGLVPINIFKFLPRFIKNKISDVEFHLWKKLNGFNSGIIRISPKRNFQNDVLISFSYKAAVGDFKCRIDLLDQFKVVIFHLSHYFIATAEKANNLKKIKNVVLAGDSDISKNKYFQKYFSWYSRPFLVLPFAVSDRFKIKTPWINRVNSVVATGTFHDLSQERPAHLYSDFISSTGSTTYHPIRKAIFESREKIKNLIDCKTSIYKKYNKSILKKIVEKFQVSQKDYFSFDIVDLYNKYQYAVVGEELSGFPALGAFEAMACGCILFACSDYYLGLNLLPGRDYIEYVNDINDLLSKIENNNHNMDYISSDKISSKIISEFNGRVIYNRWISEIEKYYLMLSHENFT